jgi:alkylation response protein AidB-like acyl-CoA dehydrogenase
MDITFSPEQEQYRVRVQEFLREVLPDGWGTAKHPLPRTPEEQAKVGLWWERTVWEHGFAGISWPKDYGGQGLTWVEQVIFSEECAKANAPGGVNGLGKGLLGPTLLVEGTEEQKRRFIPPLLKGEEVWCQGYSEPNAGSDLASLRTRAELVGDEWVITGQKIWTSNAHLADWCFVLARTDPDAPKHRGISFLLVPMHQPGVKVEPLVQITGEAHFNSVTFDGARTAKENIVGQVNDGWRVANTVLSFERGPTIVGRHEHYMREWKALLDAALSMPGPYGTAADDSHYRQRMMELWTEIEILRLHGYNVITQLQQKNRLGPEASMLKLYYSEMHKRLGELAMDVLGPDMPFAQGLGSVAGGLLHRAFLGSRAETIFAGTSQIQRNVIAERVLGLPRDDRR